MVLPLALIAMFTTYTGLGVKSYYDAYTSGEMKEHPYAWGPIGLLATIKDQINVGYELAKPTFV